jgi:hypothetical protein
MNRLKVGIFHIDRYGKASFSRFEDFDYSFIEGIYKTVHDAIWYVKLLHRHSGSFYTNTANIIRIFEAMLPEASAEAHIDRAFELETGRIVE